MGRASDTAQLIRSTPTLAMLSEGDDQLSRGPAHLHLPRRGLPRVGFRYHDLASAGSVNPVMQNEPQLGKCRLCGETLSRTFVDLGMSPLCESYVAAEQLNRMEPFYPLHVLICEKCFLVQLCEYVTADHIYSEYAYFSSYSDSWLRHAREYVDMITERLSLGPQSLVVELASND